jgi:hypothetical protein
LDNLFSSREHRASKPFLKALILASSIGEVDHDHRAAPTRESASNQLSSLSRGKATQFTPTVIADNPVFEGVVRDHVNCDVRCATDYEPDATDARHKLLLASARATLRRTCKLPTSTLLVRQTLTAINDVSDFDIVHSTALDEYAIACHSGVRAATTGHDGSNRVRMHLPFHRSRIQYG